MTQAFKWIRFEVDNQVATLTLNNPAKRNAFAPAMREEIAQVIERVSKDKEIRALILTGAGEHFCAGGDLQNIATSSLDNAGWRRRMQTLHAWLSGVMTLDRPVIAAVDGSAAGAGFSLALLADFVIATPRARFSMSFIKVGLVPDCGAFYTLPRVVGVQRARELMLSGRDVDAQEALRLGIAMELVEPDQLQSRAKAMAASFVNASPTVVSLIKHALMAPRHDLPTILEMESTAQTLAAGTEEHRIAVNRFLNKEAPPFKWPAKLGMALVGTLASTLVVGVLGLSSQPVRAQADYPSRPVTIVVPQAVGGANDTVARALQTKLAENLKRQFIVENRPGAGGNLGTVYVAKAAKDGYTLLLTAASAHTINPALYRGKHGFDSVKDFEPIAVVATAPYVLVTNPAFPVKSVKELIAYVKARPGQVNYASAGNGTTNHLLGEMFKQSAGLFMVHIPYRGASAAATDVVGGQIPLTFGSLPGVQPFVKSGQLRLLAVAEPKRSPLIPDTPTLAEAVPGLSTISWYGLFAPAGTPKDVTDKIYAEVQKVLSNKEFQERLAGQGAAVSTLNRQEFAALIKEDLAKMGKIVRDSNAQVD